MADVANQEEQTLLEFRRQGELAVELARQRPFATYTHAQMLGDDRRLEAFRTAIDALVWDGATVVDIGTGTGILASYAAARTSGMVHALDVDPHATALATRLCLANGLSNVRVANTASYGRPIDCEPDVVISETLGVVGVDERIVETLYEFCLRYPSVRVLIPSLLRVYAVSVRSQAMRAHVDGLIAKYTHAGRNGYRFDSALADIRHALGCSVVSASFDDAVANAPPQLLAEYQLGKSRTSRFSQTLTVPSESDGVLMYFVADLGAGQTLSTSLSDPPNHWGRAWALRPNAERQLQIASDPRKSSFDLYWE
jgi:predicted RNA methylase